jgi:hypothetical protein
MSASGQRRPPSELIFAVSGKPIAAPSALFKFDASPKRRGRVVDPITVLVVLAVGFTAGYGVRAWKSRKRRRRYAERNEVAGVFGR